MGSITKVALVTGGGSGIGKAVALALAGEGYAVVVAGRREEPLQATVEEGSKLGARVLSVPTDVGDPQSVKVLFARTSRRSAGWTSCSTTQVQGLRPCRSKTLPSNNGNRSSMQISPVRFSAPKRRSRS